MTKLGYVFGPADYYLMYVHELKAISGLALGEAPEWGQVHPKRPLTSYKPNLCTEEKHSHPLNVKPTECLPNYDNSNSFTSERVYGSLKLAKDIYEMAKDRRRLKAG